MKIKIKKGVALKMKAITRTAAGVTAAAIAVTSSIAAVNADNDKYTKPYTIANVLTDYQFFVEGNFEHGGHTVGAVAIGGSAKIGAFGDGQVAPSYIHHIESVGNFSDCSWVDEAYKAHNVYYGESDIGERTNFVKNDDFIDFTEAMSRIRKESQWIADKGTKIGRDCYDVSSKTITVDLKANSSKSYTIDYSLFSEARTLNFTGLTVAEFAKGGYTLSVVGVNGEAGIDFTSWGSNGTRINLNGQGLDGKLKDLEGGINGGQFNATGTPLLYNFPDATKLDINYLAGGLCAPNATVSIQGGNYEGNVIAGSISEMNAEAHFFSYYPITEQGDTTYPAIDGDQSGSSSTTTTTSVSASKPASSNTTTTSKSNTTTTTTTSVSASKPVSSNSTTTSKSNTTTTTTTSASASKPASSNTTTTSKSNTTTTTTTSVSASKPASSNTTTTSKSNTTTTTTTSASASKPASSNTTTTSKSNTTTTTTTSASASKPANSNSTTTSNSSVTTTSAKADEKPDSATSTSASGSDAISTSSSDAAATTTSSEVGGVSDTKATDDPAQTGSASESGSVSSSSQTGTSAVGGTEATAASTTTKKTADGSTGTSTTTKKTAADAESAKKSRAVDGASAANPKTGAAATTAAAVLLAAASVIAAAKKNKD